MQIGALNNDIDNSSFNTLSKISVSTDYIIKTVNFLLGTIGLILIIPLLSFLSLLLFGVSFWLKLKLKKALKIAYDKVNSMSQDEIIEAHLAFEQTKIKLNTIRKNGSKETMIFLFNPFFNQTSQIIHLIDEAETTFKKAAYPELNMPISTEHIEELREKLSKIEGWKDEDLDIYEKVYC